MLLDLPITNVRLLACPVAAEQLSPVAGGHFCASCQRLVHDFTQAGPAALAAAQAAAPDGRVCGRFRSEQLASGRPLPTLRPKLRQFLLAAVLILVQGLTAGQAWAQANPRVPFRAAAGAAPLYQLPGTMPQPSSPANPVLPQAALATPDSVATKPEYTFIGVYVEHMPEPPGGMEGLAKYLRKHLRYPRTALRTRIQGKVFVSFTVTTTGQVTEAEVMKGLHPALDAEALRVVQLMPPWTPGRRNGLAENIRYTLPITFSLTDDAPLQPPPSRKRRH